MKQYETPVLSTISFEEKDVITTSGVTEASSAYTFSMWADFGNN